MTASQYESIHQSPVRKKFDKKIKGLLSLHVE